MWNHRIVKHHDDIHVLAEVYYDINKRPHDFEEAKVVYDPGDESTPAENLRKQLHWMLDATHLPVLTWPDDFDGEKP